MGSLGDAFHGKIINLSVPVAVNTTIATITLPPGKWLIIASMWTPGAASVSLNIEGIAGFNGVAGHPQVVGYVIISHNTEYKITCSQWGDDTITIVDPQTVAVRTGY